MSLKEIKADIKEINAKLDQLVALSVEQKNLKEKALELDARLSNLEKHFISLAILTVGGGVIGGVFLGLKKALI